METKFSKLRAAWIAPCIGIGGADAYMLGLIRYAHNIEWTGVAIGDQITPEQFEWTRRMVGPGGVNIHQFDHGGYQLPGVTYHKYPSVAVYAAVEHADVVITWCFPKVAEMMEIIRKPIIDLAQNEDDYAKKVASSNKNNVNYRVACSESAAKAFGNVPVDAVIYNAIDPGRVTPRLGREMTRKVMGLTDRKILLYMGRLVSEKFPEGVIQALHELGEEWCGVFVGDGYLKDTMVDEAQRWLGKDRIYFVDSQYHVGDILAAGDVFILPSDFEGLPLAVCEAWFAGIPTVVTDINVMRELQESFGPTAVYVPVRPTPQQLAEAVLKADSRSEEVQGLIENARGLAWHELTLPRAAAKWESFLHTVVHQWRERQLLPQIQGINPVSPHTDSRALVRTISKRNVGDAWDA